MSSRLTSPAKSKYSFRLLFFTALSVMACMLALANVASAATPSGEDQYLEQTPNAGGKKSGSNNQYVTTVGGKNGAVTEQDAKKQAEKNKKKKQEKDEGATGSTGASGAAGTGAKPPSTGAPVQSVATSAKLGPFSRTTGLALAALIAALLGGVAFTRSRAPQPDTGS